MTTAYHWPPKAPHRVTYTPYSPLDTGEGSVWTATFYPTGATCRVTYTRERQYPGLGPGAEEHCHARQYLWAAQHILGASATAVIDYGCGSGWGASVLAQTEGQVIGMDASREAVAFALRMFPGDYEILDDIDTPEVEIVKAFNDHSEWLSASHIVAIDSIEHVQDAESALRGLRAVAWERGKLLLTTPNRDARKKHQPPSPFHVREYNPAELEALLETTGWGVVEWKSWPSDVTMGVIAEAV